MRAARRVDHTLPLIDKLHLRVLALHSDTIGEYDRLHVHVVDQLQCKDISLNIYIFVLNLVYFLSFESFCYRILYIKDDVL